MTKSELIDKLKLILKHHTHNITDDKLNQWEVVEHSDIDDLIKEAEDELRVKTKDCEEWVHERCSCVEFCNYGIQCLN